MTTIRDTKTATPGSPRKLQPGQALPVDVVDVQPINMSGAHEFYTGRMADSGMPVFVKHNSPKGLFKAKVLEPVNKLIKMVAEKKYPNLDELQDLNEVTFSHFAKAYFERQGRPYSGLAYQQVFFTDPQTHRPRVGIAAPLIDNLETLDDVPASQVSNPHDAVEQTLLRGLVMGDWNCTYRNQNIGVAGPETRISDGRPLQPGEIIDMDYGDGGTGAITKLGVPYGNRALLQAHPDCIRPALDNICKLTPEAIRSMVEASGRDVTGWSPELTDYYSGILSGNLQNLKDRLAQDPDWVSRASHNPMLQPGHASIKQFIFRIPAGVMEARQTQSNGVLDHVPSANDLAALVAAQKQYPNEIHATQA